MPQQSLFISFVIIMLLLFKHKPCLSTDRFEDKRDPETFGFPNSADHLDRLAGAAIGGQVDGLVDIIFSVTVHIPRLFVFLVARAVVDKVDDIDVAIGSHLAEARVSVALSDHIRSWLVHGQGRQFARLDIFQKARVQRGATRGDRLGDGNGGIRGQSYGRFLCGPG
jgi:hypothetical protein